MCGGLRIIHSATFASGATEIEFAGDAGNTSVVFERNEKSRANTLMEIPSGGEVRYYANRELRILGSDEVIIDSFRKMSAPAVRKIVAIAIAFDRSERDRSNELRNP